MKQSIFDRLISGIAAKLNIIAELGTPITNGLIAQKIDELAVEYRQLPNFEMTEEDVARLKFHIGTMFNVRVGEAAISLHNPDLPRWFDSKKSELAFPHWDTYKEMLLSQGRSREIIRANEEVIDHILDYSGDPTTPGSWARKGLVMGNVQSGKTQNYIGLINKAIDCGYKTIILLGGHLNDLRKQTQERVDEGVLGRQSKHLVDVSTTAPSPIGVGIFRENSLNTGTTTIGDFNKGFADRLGFKLTAKDPVIFVIKKHVGVMERLYKWIKEYHYLEPEMGKRLEGPLLLIDDEADYASINTKHHKEEVTKTNDFIRNLLSLFHRNTYVAYTATPFANIFIDPDDSAFSDKDDLFPSDFMIKIPVPTDYLGQDFYFGRGYAQELEEEDRASSKGSPTIPIVDYGPVYELKSADEILEIPESLKEAIRAFILVIAVRSVRGEKSAHNTMLVNISHLKVHQNRLEVLIAAYHKELDDALDSFLGLGLESARGSEQLRQIEKTFGETFSIDETYQQVFSRLREASGRIKVWAINQSSRNADGRELNYSTHKEHGLCAIVIGGHKLSRGLTLEGLSVSYFARNSKAYDTLMQMCRWFGYRPNYADLCRVYLPPESIDWYAFISAAIRELYQELELMARRERRPSEFGLKVREHPGAMIITAKNKIGWGETDIRSQDLWGQVQRRFRFPADIEVNRRNLNYTASFVRRLLKERAGTEDCRVDEASQSLVVSNVEYKDIIEYVERMDLPEDDLGNAALKSHLKKMKNASLGLPKVVVFNQASLGRPKWEQELSNAERVFVNEPYVFSDAVSINLPKRFMQVDKDYFKVKSVHLGNPDDEKLFLSNDERNRVSEQATRNAVSFDYICSDDRDYPGLLIYHFAVAIQERSTPEVRGVLRLGHGLMPTVGYTISIPRSENLKGKTRKEISDIVKNTKHSYRVGKIYRRLQELSAYEEYEDEE